MMSSMTRVMTLGLTLMTASAGAPAQNAAATPVSSMPNKPMPFEIGERLVYDVKFGPVKVGTGTMQVVGTQELRGHDVFHTRFTVKGGTFFYRVNDVLESWFDRNTLASLRFHSDQEEGGRKREKTYEIHPDRKVYVEIGKEGEQPSVENPLDDGSFLYFIRTVPLEVGKTYEFNRYFRPDRNPVKVKVLRKEQVSVPAGKFNAVVVQPIIKAKGIFSENGQAEIWLSDDDTRMMLQMKSKLSFGSLNLYLRSYTSSTKVTTNPGRD